MAITTLLVATANLFSTLGLFGIIVSLVMVELRRGVLEVPIGGWLVVSQIYLGLG